MTEPSPSLPEHLAWLRTLRKLDAANDTTTIYRCMLCHGDDRHEECPR